MAINRKQQLFAKEYIIDFNVTRAAARAGYSEKTAHAIGHKLLKIAEIQKEIELQLAERSKRTEVTADRVLLEIARLAFNDPRKAFNKNNALLDIHDWPDEVAAAISSIKVQEVKVDGVVIGETKEVKFWDKGKQLELAGKHLGMFEKAQAKDSEEEAAPVQIIFNTIDASVKAPVDDA